MDRRGSPAGWDSRTDPPSVLQVTVLPGPAQRREVRRPSALIAGLGTLPALAVAAVIAVLPGGSGGSAASRAPTPVVPTPARHLPLFPTPGVPVLPPTTVLVHGGGPSTTLLVDGGRTTVPVDGGRTTAGAYRLMLGYPDTPLAGG